MSFPPGQHQNLLIVNYSMNLESQVFAHQPQIVEELANFFDNVSVITSESKFSSFKINVKVQAGWLDSPSRFLKGINLLEIFIRELIILKPSVVFFHMTDVHAAILAPVARLFRVPVVLWYAHAHRSRYLILSRLFINTYVSSTTGSFPLKSKKVKFIGQSIKSSMFPFTSRDKYEFKSLIHIGRVDTSKNIRLLVDTVKQYRHSEKSATLTLIGSRLSKTSGEASLSSTTDGGGYEFLHFVSPIPRHQIASTLSDYDCFIHAFNGSLDKSILEATFTGIPVVTSNPEYIKEFGTWCWHNPRCHFTLLSELFHLSEMTNDRINQVVNLRSQLARSGHEFDQWISRLVGTLTKS